MEGIVIIGRRGNGGTGPDVLDYMCSTKAQYETLAAAAELNAVGSACLCDENKAVYLHWPSGWSDVDKPDIEL